MSTHLHKGLSEVRNIRRIFALVWEASRSLTLGWIVLLVAQGLVPVGIVSLTRVLVDSLAALIQSGGAPEHIDAAMSGIILMAVLILAKELLQSAGELVRTVQAERLHDHITGLVHSKSVAVDIAFYDSSEFYDHLHRARSDATWRSLALLDSSGGLLQNGVTFIALAAVLTRYGLLLPVALVLSTLPTLYVVLRFSRRHHNWWKQTTVDRRRAEYFDTMLSSAPSAAELRLFGLGDFYRESYSAIRKTLRERSLRLALQQAVARLAAGLVLLGTMATAVIWMIGKATAGAMTLGDLALFYQAFMQSEHLARALLSDTGTIYSNSLYITNLFAFLELEEQVKEPARSHRAPTLRHGISFQNVTFSYPGSESMALHNFNLEIPAGQVVAVVGDNGSGKSTLVKLLCRFYDPQAGHITFDGVDIRNMHTTDLRRLISVLFQVPVPYQTTATENITIGDRTGDINGAAIHEAARAASAEETIEGLSQGYDTVLGKWFVDGQELSSGQWQRIALARALYRKAQLLILDEPTSFIDPWSEVTWFDRFRPTINGRTTLIITHRFTVAMRADIIHVMRDGRIIESGTHDELLVCDGYYAQSWYDQTRSIRTVEPAKPATLSADYADAVRVAGE